MKYNKYESGVYAIYDFRGTCLYVGATGNFLSRYSKHLFHLKSGTHHNEQLQLIINSMGLDNVEFIPIFFCSMDTLFMNEQRFITLLSPICNSKRSINLSDFKFNESGDKLIIFNHLKDVYKNTWVSMKDILPVINRMFGDKKSVTKKSIGMVLSHFGVMKKRIGIKNETQYFIPE